MVTAASPHGTRAIHLYGVLRADIEDGRYPAGTALPALKSLAREFGVAVGTVQQALERLERDGLVQRRSRQGTFVRDTIPRTGPLATLQSILDSETDAIITQTLDGTILSWNRGAERLYGYTENEVVGRPISILLPPDRPSELPEVFRRLHLGQTIEPYTSVRVRKDGRRVDVRISITPLRDSAGQVVGATAIGCDLTYRTEAERRNREHALMLDAVGDAVIAIDLDGTVRYWNRAAERLYGWEAEEVFGKGARFFVAPSMPVEQVLQQRRDLASGGTVSGEWELTRKDGSTFLARVSTTALWEPDGTLSGFIGTSSDLTERMRVLDQLRRSEERYRTLFTASPVGIVVGIGGRLVECNDAYRRILGYSLEDRGGVRWEDMTHPEDLEREMPLYDELVRGERDHYTVEKRYIHTNGSEVWASVTVAFARDEEGSVLFDIAVIEDITARKRAEDALERSQEWYRSVVEASTDGIIVQSLHGEIIFANPRAAALLGYASPADLAGRPVIELFPEDEWRRLIQENRKLIARGTYEAGEFVARRRDGSTFPVEIAGAAIKNDRGRPVALTGVFRDITGRKRAVEAVQRSERRFRAIFEKAPIGIASGDRTGHVLHCNEAYRAMFGYTYEELKQLGFHGMTHPDDVAEDARKFQMLVAGEIDGYELTKRMFRKDGTTIWVHLAISAIRDSDGNFLSDIALVEDITQHLTMQEALRASQERFRVAFEGAPIGVILADASGWPITANAAFQEMVGRSEEDLRQLDFTALTHPDDVEKDVQLAVELIAGMRDSYQVDKRYLRPDGSVVWAHLAASLVRDANGEPQFVISMVEDISERKRAEGALRASEERYRAVIETSQDGIVIRDLEGTILVINERGCELLGFDSPAEAVGHKVNEGVPLEERDVLDSSAVRLLREGRDAVEITLVGRKGRRFPAELRRTVMTDADGNAYAATTVIRDVTERKRYEDELRHRALYDPLTGLANRTLFEDRVVRALHTSERDQSIVSILLLDLDRFKDVNDTLGHASGDVLLQQVSARFEQKLRNVDTVARLGGDEFAVLLVGNGRVQAESIATRILTSLSEPFEIGEHLLYTSASIGIALSPEHGTDLATLLRRADIAMYSAKRGAHGYMVYEPAADSQSTRRLTLVSELRRAIDTNQLMLYYQPVIDIETGSASHVEVLARWDHPDLGYISPGEFIPLAEQTGLIKLLTIWVLNEAMRQVAEWRSQGLDISVAVNLSTWNFQDRNIVDVVGTALASHGVPPGALTLEITESALMADPVRARDTVIFLRDMGARVAIDDFGTGYSSLGYLQRLPVQEVKIDRSFIVGISTEHPESLSIVRAVLSLGQSLGMTVVAEGVETQQHLDILTAAGCSRTQGYLFSKPVPAEQYCEWLRAWNSGTAALKACSA